MPRNARLAVLFSALLHGGLILAARYRLSYDAYNHMFFGDHYRLDWWSLWEPRWYTGFFVTSYPPLIHQLIGALSHVIGLDAAFGVLLWLTVAVFPLSVYCFARIFLGKTPSGYAALGAAFLPSAYLTAHTFGQLPTLAGTTTALFWAAALARYLREGSRLNGTLAVSLLSTVVAFHHGILLFLPWLLLAVLTRQLLSRPLPWRTLTLRLAVVGTASLLAVFVVIWPFWEWGRMQSLQVAIDHASRHNFFSDSRAPMMFFLPVYGPLLLVLPAVLFLARRRRLVGLGISFCLLFILGLGGTTPLPRFFFGRGWEWLTYDRFAFWASLVLLPFLGIILTLLKRRSSTSVPVFFFPLAATALFVGLLTAFVPLQPGAVDMQQVVSFLARGEHAQWRYLTFGFGDQLALLSTLTTARTIDGSYHTARTLPELRLSGVGQIDTAFWLPGGLAKLDAILQTAGAYGVRWGFVNIPQYVPLLQRNGWLKITTLRDGVQVWENPDAVRPDLLQVPPTNLAASFSWGTLPLLSLVTTLSLGSLRLWPLQAEEGLRRMYTFVVALVPLSLGFWYFKTLFNFAHHRVYFTYTDPLVFLADGLVLLSLVFWCAVKLKTGFSLTPFVLPVAFCLLAFLSSFWSGDWRISLYVSFHMMLTFIFVLSLRDQPQAWNSLLFGLCAALSLQLITGVVGFLKQSTAFLEPLGLKWPGVLDPAVQGAIVVQMPDGESILRAYGTLPHPNLLGGFCLLLLLGPIALFMRREKPDHLAGLLIAGGVSLLALTFSRSAWLALAGFCAIVVWKSNFLGTRRSGFLVAIIALSFILTLLPYPDLVQARTISATSHAEEFSFLGRAWLNGSAIDMFRENPLTGVGVGSFIVELARRAGEGYIVEPAHDVFLLAAAELGLPGVLLASVFFVMFARRLVRTSKPNAILAGGALAGLLIISLFDHYLWTLAPGRLMLGLAAGLFLSQDITRGE